MLRGSSLPCSFLVLANSLLASLQLSLNHGASVFPHLLGFFGGVITVYRTTPASTAWSNINYSTASARSSFVRCPSDTRALNSFINVSVSVYSRHFYADSA
jgi:hypothetical protein